MEVLARVRRVAATVLIAAACAPHAPANPDLAVTAPALVASETTTVVKFALGVTATIVSPRRLNAFERTDLIVYALPNGNTTEQTMGRAMTPGLDWHFDIQHIAAQTRALRTMGVPQAVVAYLEVDTRSWPAWRSTLGYDSANKRIVRIVDSLRSALGVSSGIVPVTLTGHSGGGSFIFGFIEGQDTIPNWIDRIAFLDANYNFDPKHGDKLVAWLRGRRDHTLVSLAYDDREITLDGKRVVSDSGGTWRATDRMVKHLRATQRFRTDTLAGFIRHRSEQVHILAHPNPLNRILHTEMIGEMNGYLHAMLVRDVGYVKPVLGAPRAYTRWVAPPE